MDKSKTYSIILFLRKLFTPVRTASDKYLIALLIFAHISFWALRVNAMLKRTAWSKIVYVQNKCIISRVSWTVIEFCYMNAIAYIFRALMTV